MEQENNKVDEFLAKLPAKEVYDGGFLSNIVEQSGLPKEDFLHNEAFQDFVLARLSVNALKGTLCPENDRKAIIRPMIAKDARFAERFLDVADRGGRSWNLGFMGYINAVADVATLSDHEPARKRAFEKLESYTNHDINVQVNVIGHFYPEHIENLKEPDLFMKLAEKQLDVGMKDMNSRGFAAPFDSYALLRLKEFSEKFPVYKERVGLLVKKAKDNSLIKKGNYSDREDVEHLIGDIPAAKLEKLRQNAAKAVGLEKVKMPFKGVERRLSQMIFEKKGGKSGK